MALILYRPIFWVVFALTAVLLLWIALRTHLRWVPAYFSRLLMLVTILAYLFFPKENIIRPVLPGREITILDESASIPSAVREQNRQQALLWQQEAENRILIHYGVQSQAVIPSQESWPPLDDRSSNMAAALKQANRLLQGQTGKITLISDGIVESTAQIDQLIREIAAQSNILNVIPVAQTEPPDDAYIGPLWIPEHLWEKTTFAANLQIHMPQNASVKLQLEVNNQPYSERVEKLAAGDQSFNFTVQVQSSGLIALKATAIVDGDPNPNNNVAYATARIFPAPRVIFATDEVEQAAKFTLALAQDGIRVDVVTPDQIPSDYQTLNKYQVIFLDNLMIQNLTEEQITTIKVAVSKFGKGLILLGGRYTYTLGGYDNSLLEPILPVKMEPPERRQREPVTFVLVIDGSYSMAGTEINLAREAAMRVIETLNSDDTLGIVTYSDESVWDMPMEKIGEGLNLRKAIDTTSGIGTSGGTQMFRALKEVISTMGPQTGNEKRNLLLLSDGKSTDGTDKEFQSLTAQAINQDITISTIALGGSADQETMSNIAKWANGRYYLVSNAEELPKVMIHETRATQSENIQEGETSLLAQQLGHPILSGMNLAYFPTLTGYNALKSRTDEGAEDILVSSSFGDPLLSSWQYGLGRVVAWMGDTGEEWAVNWTTWSDLGRFWSQVVRYALPDPALESNQIHVAIDETQVRFAVQLQDDAGVPTNLTQVEALLSGPDNKTYKFNLPQISPGFYQGAFPRPPLGTYLGNIEYLEPGSIVKLPVHFAVNLPKELLPADNQVAHRNLVEWATQTGGKQATWEELLMQPSAPLQEEVDQIDLLMWLLPALLLFWPVEIFIRRRWLPWK